MNIPDIVLIVLEIVLSLLLIIPAKLSKKLISTKWRILFAVPAVVCMIIAGFSGFEKLLLPTYIGAAVTLAGFFIANEKLRIRVPFDEDAVRVLFDEDGDYVMQKAVEQINHMK